MSTMDLQRIKHLQKESESWKRLLEYIQQENSHLKNILADIVSQDIGENMLDEVEEFQNRFLRKDEMIALLRRDIRDNNDWLYGPVGEATKDIDKYYTKQKKLRNDIEVLEQRFNKLKFEFLNYIADKT